MYYIAPTCHSEFDQFTRPKHLKDYPTFAKDIADELATIPSFESVYNGQKLISQREHRRVIKRFFKNSANQRGTGAGYRLTLYAVPTLDENGVPAKPLSGVVYILYFHTHVGSLKVEDVTPKGILNLMDRCDKSILDGHSFLSLSDWQESMAKGEQV